MFCSNCGKEIENDVAFCKYCGSATASQNSEKVEHIQNTADTQQEMQPVESDSNSDALSNDDICIDGQPDTDIQATTVYENHKSKIHLAIVSIAISLIAVLIVVVINAIAPPNFEDMIVTYTGDTQAGVVLNKSNKGINVVGVSKGGKEKKIQGWTIDEPKTLQEDSSATINITYNKISKNLTVKCSSSAIIGISAEYKGSLAAGTTVDFSNNEISVFANHKNGEKTEVTTECVFEPSSVTLNRDAIETINVKYGEFYCRLELICSDRTVKEIKVKYTGPTTEGTTIGSNNKYIEVTALFTNGLKEKVTGWAIEQPVTLEADLESEVTIKYKDKSCTIKVQCSTVSDAKYKAGCESISYTELARTPDAYKGRHVKFTGEIVQVLDDSSSDYNMIEMRIATKKFYSSYMDNVVYVTYVREKKSPRFLEDDKVTFYGEFLGLITYESIMGAKVTIP
nr:zinc-ribbon domain-containing protein [Clostridiales bacterium]